MSCNLAGHVRAHYVFAKKRGVVFLFCTDAPRQKKAFHKAPSDAPDRAPSLELHNNDTIE
jgi:hypothetical protein